MPINFEDYTIQGALRSKNPVMVGYVPVKHVPLSKITSPEIGYSLYNQLLGLLCISEEQYKHKIDLDSIPDPLTMLCAFALGDKKNKHLLDRACILFFGKIPTIDADSVKLVFHSDSLLKCPSCLKVVDKSKLTDCPECGTKLIKSVSFEITHDNFNDVISVLKKRNGALSKDEEDDGNPANETARQMIARRNELRKKRARLSKNKSGISVWEMVDIFASISQMTYSDVMEFDVFQLQTQMERYKSMDDYEVGVQSLLHGAKKSDVNLKHWLRKIDANDDDNDDKNDE